MAAQPGRRSTPDGPAARPDRHRQVRRIGPATAVAALVVLVAVPAPALAAPILGPTATQRAETVTLLERATAEQGTCYGWRLSDGDGNVVSQGSNLGDGVPVSTDPVRCPASAEVVAVVNWTAESSEAEDSAVVRVQSTRADELALLSGLRRLGVTDAVFVDDPGWAVTRAATFLPLLAVEQDLASPAPAPTAGVAAAPPPLPQAGSDFWRDRWPLVVGAAVVLLVAGLLAVIGFAQRRRQRPRPL